MNLPDIVLEYLVNQRLGVLAVEMPDGSPHAATVHFAHAAEPLRFYYETYREYRKAEPILANAETRASFVVGVDEKDMKTLQLDGIIKLIMTERQGDFDAVYFAKFPDKRKKVIEKDMIFFEFIPTWWRFTDWETSDGKMILSSNDRS